MLSANNKRMTKRISKRVISITAVCLVLALLIGLAFLPTVRARGGATVQAATEYDSDGIAKLSTCTAYVAAHGFSTTMTGKITARVLGVKYTQKVSGGRTVDGDRFTDTAQSISSLVKVALRREYDGEEYKIYRGEYRDKDKTFAFDNGKTVDKQQYVGLYGKPNIGVVKYAVDSSVMSVKKVGDNAYRFALDPVRATAYCKNEVKTTLGGKSYPHYSSIEFTLYFDGDRPIKVTSVEKFRVDKLGGTDCTAEYTETFKFNSEL